MKLVVTIISNHAYRRRRDAVRDTWLKHLPPGTPYFFYLGKGDTELEPDVLETPFEDTRAANAHKTHFAFNRALQKYEFDWLFRVDDDTFVVPERIPSLLWEPKAEMIGGECMWQWGWSTGGAGLLFTRRLIQHMVDAGIGTEGGNGDDGWACWRARQAGAQFFWTPRLRHQGDIRPHPNNDTVTGHYVSPREMRILQDLMDKGDPVWLRKTGIRVSDSQSGTH
jgi:hypothetical protein